MEMKLEFERRKQRVKELIAEIPGWTYAEPDGAFYVFPQVDYYFGKSIGTEVIANADDLCMYLLNTAHVSTVTGRAFGSPNCIRLSFANSLEKIEEAYRRIKVALANLK
jgi:aspartate aminotransferase